MTTKLFGQEIGDTAFSGILCFAGRGIYMLFMGFLHMQIKNAWATNCTCIRTFGIWNISDTRSSGDGQIFVVLAFAVVVFVVCAGLEKLRLRIWKVFKVDALLDKISRTADKASCLLMDCFEN